MRFVDGLIVVEDVLLVLAVAYRLIEDARQRRILRRAARRLVSGSASVAAPTLLDLRAAERFLENAGTDPR